MWLCQSLSESSILREREREMDGDCEAMEIDTDLPEFTFSEVIFCYSV